MLGNLNLRRTPFDETITKLDCITPSRRLTGLTWSRDVVLCHGMGTPEFSFWILLTSVLAGLLGSLTGLGGGVVIVPALTLLFHIDIHYAIGASLVSVIATSSGAAAAYVREGYSNIRIGMFLEIATTFGALFGAWLTTRVSTHAIGIIFGVVLLYSAWASVRMKPHPHGTGKPDALAARLRMSGVFPGENGPEPYAAERVPAGFSLMFLAGSLSGLLGIGSGAVKVAGDGSGDAPAVQGIDDDQQLHDRRDGRGERGNLSQPGLHLAGAGDAGDARRSEWLDRGLEDPGACGSEDSPHRLRGGYCGSGPGNDYQQHRGKAVEEGGCR